MSDNPEKAPAPKSLALMCAIHAWAHDIDDDSRKLLEWSHETIVSLMDRLVRQAGTIELIEARIDELEARS